MPKTCRSSSMSKSRAISQKSLSRKSQTWKKKTKCSTARSTCSITPIRIKSCRCKNSSRSRYQPSRAERAVYRNKSKSWLSKTISWRMKIWSWPKRESLQKGNIMPQLPPCKSRLRSWRASCRSTVWISTSFRKSLPNSRKSLDKARWYMSKR